ncbi:dITP/XTP pyrophosphatase [Bacteroidales bacterium]|nr:dITP/XTP pyrophosphatase [Bacteroidales bacterium]
MKKKIVFASDNAHKIEEVKKMLGSQYEVLSLKDIGCTEEIPETANTLQGNALLKALYVKNKFALDCFADDTGLEIKSLNNAPGVYSARYAGPERDAAANRLKVLSELKNLDDRSAAFKTVIILLIGDEQHVFEGLINGQISLQQSGEGGFGYDPIFIPQGHQQTFAQLEAHTKNKISHRALAVEKLKHFLESQSK